MMLRGFGATAHEGASTGRLMQDQATWDIEPNEAYAADGQILMARSQALARNNAYARACINALSAGTIGPCGLIWKSTYDSDPDRAQVEETDIRQRRNLSRIIARAMRSIDAAGLASPRAWQAGLLYSKAVFGDAFQVRVSVARPNATHQTAWRTVHPARVCNPNYGADTDRLRQGVALDPQGSPVGLWIASAHPNSLNHGPMTWVYRPLLDADGLEQVIWASARLEPEQIRSPGWFAPVMSLLVHLGKVTEAHVVAKRLQACLGMIVEVEDPVAAARKDRNGVAWTANTTMKPGKTYYVKKGANVRPFDFKYEGGDFDAFTTALLMAICAAFGPGVPWQFALQQLTKSNMASSRAALMQAWRSFRTEQVELEQSLRIVVRNYLAEDLARGRLVLPTGDDLEAASAGYFVPPQRLSSDDNRELEAAKSKREVLGISRTTLSREYGGYDLDDERQQDVEDASADERAGVTRPAPAPATTPDQPIKDDQDIEDQDDGEEDQTDDQADDDQADGTDEGEPTGDDEDQMP
jgi:capsid protein